MYSILIPEGYEYLSLAAEEFARITEKISGIKPPIIHKDDGGDIVSLGSDAVSPLAHEYIANGRLKDFSIRTGSDDYQMVSVEDETRTLLFLAGGRIRSLFYCIYHFFEERAACHWFWDGDIIPSGPAPDIKDLNLASSPHFQYRGLRYFAHRSLTRFQAEQWNLDDWKREIDWMLKRRLNIFMLRIGIDDLFQRAFPEIVHYPENFECPEAKPDSFDDRTLFWSLEDRSRLRKAILEYAFKRDLLHPEDFGTPTHWYSRTPLEFLNKVKPELMPQSNSNYAEHTGLIWDIRNDQNLENYFKLTDAHIKEYGSPKIFHTIGTGERRFYPDHFRNHETKRYAYRRIIAELRRRYGDAPLLIGSWDFISTWTHDEVQEFIAELDPANTIILDYTSDICDEVNNFQNWGILGEFPWIYGIFHAYEPSNEIRGNYANIRERFPKAAKDKMCKGVVFWPENSHQDTLMLEYFSEIAWTPEHYKLEEFLPIFCSRRYSKEARPMMERLWNLILPVAMASRWGTVGAYKDQYYPMREVFPDPYFNLQGWFYGNIGPKRNDYFNFQTSILSPKIPALCAFFREIASLNLGDLTQFQRRDIIDMARTAVARAIDLELSVVGLLLNGLLRSAPVFGKKIVIEDLFRSLEIVRDLGTALSDILESSPEFSLYHSLKDLEKGYKTNPNFEPTLKGNADNGYCRSFIYELARYSYEPVFKAVADHITDLIKAQDRRAFIHRETEFDAIIDVARKGFKEKTLFEMQPDIDKATHRLQNVFRRLSSLMGEINATTSTPAFTE